MSQELDDEELKAMRRTARLGVLAALGALGGSGRRGDVLGHAVRHGGFTLRETAAPADPAWGGRYRSRLDRELAWTLTNLRRDGLVKNPARGIWALAGAAAETPAPIAAPAATSRLDQLRTMPYREYLRTPEWRETRAAALVRAGHACSLDATHLDGLEVHHRSYDRVGAELPQDLTVLCRDCHRLHHKANGRPGRRPAEPVRSVAPPGAAAEPLYVPVDWQPLATVTPLPPKKSLLRRLLGS